ncbi:MAG: hypothetical protein M5U28_19430 [Sandaracinaceae bacterium]|nr:hypothetical protein [Sandaracinaceae bacterium]
MPTKLFVGLSACFLLAACESPVERPPPPEHQGIYGFAGGCYAIDATEPGSNDTRWLEPTEDGEGLAFTARELDAGSRFYLKASDLGTYLFYDAERRYLLAEDGVLQRRAELLSDILLVDDAYQSPAEWELQVSAHDPARFQLRQRSSGQYLTTRGLAADEAEAAVVALYPATGCAEHPELSLDAEGEVARTELDDGDLFGIVDTHSHLLSNFGFGGGGIFHGSTFHRLGVQHALPDCTMFHGPEGRFDLFGYGYDQGSNIDQDVLLSSLVTGRLSEFNHHTDGFPTFTDWPSAPRQLDAPGPVLPLAAARLPRRAAPHRAARHDQPDHLRAPRREPPARSLLLQRHGRRRSHHRGDLQHGALRRRAGGRPGPRVVPPGADPGGGARGHPPGQDGGDPGHRDLQPLRLLREPAGGLPRPATRPTSARSSIATTSSASG